MELSGFGDGSGRSRWRDRVKWSRKGYRWGHCGRFRFHMVRTGAAGSMKSSGGFWDVGFGFDRERRARLWRRGWRWREWSSNCCCYCCSRLLRCYVRRWHWVNGNGWWRRRPLTRPDRYSGRIPSPRFHCVNKRSRDINVSVFHAVGIQCARRTDFLMARVFRTFSRQRAVGKSFPFFIV